MDHTLRSKGTGGNFEVMEIFSILMVVVVTWTYTFIKIQWSVYLK